MNILIGLQWERTERVGIFYKFNNERLSMSSGLLFHQYFKKDISSMVYRAFGDSMIYMCGKIKVYGDKALSLLMGLFPLMFYIWYLLWCLPICYVAQTVLYQCYLIVFPLVFHADLSDCCALTVDCSEVLHPGSVVQSKGPGLCYKPQDPHNYRYWKQWGHRTDISWVQMGHDTQKWQTESNKAKNHLYATLTHTTKVHKHIHGFNFLSFNDLFAELEIVFSKSVSFLLQCIEQV